MRSNAEFWASLVDITKSSSPLSLATYYLELSQARMANYGLSICALQMPLTQKPLWPWLLKTWSSLRTKERFNAAQVHCSSTYLLESSEELLPYQSGEDGIKFLVGGLFLGRGEQDHTA